MKITNKIAKNIYFNSIEKENLTNDNAVIFYVKDALEYRLNLLKENFPKQTLHAISIKTCDHPNVLKHIVKLGFGLEAASFEEVLLAKNAGADNQKIIFDSPVKTRNEIQYCHENLPGILLNANSIEELKRYPSNFSGRLGLRINPLVDLDVPGIFNVSSKMSKFGVPISKYEEIVSACIFYPQITCLHIHIGSAIKDFSSNLQAIKMIADLANEINKQRTDKGIYTKINILDIGGGIEFGPNNSSFSIHNFVKEIQQIPQLLEKFKLITEFGAFVHKDCCFVVSDVEYVVSNTEDSASIIFLHIGADLFVRKIYSDQFLNYPFSVINLSKKKERKKKLYNVVGPLCFAGDILYENVFIPELDEGDKFIIYEIGANTFSMWSKHCNRTKPKFLFVEA